MVDGAEDEELIVAVGVFGRRAIADVDKRASGMPIDRDAFKPAISLVSRPIVPVRSPVKVAIVY